jgi:hypothetical protein
LARDSGHQLCHEGKPMTADEFWEGCKNRPEWNPLPKTDVTLVTWDADDVNETRAQRVSDL